MGWGSFEVLSAFFSTLNTLDVCIEIYFQKHIIKGKETEILSLC
jgi:hypothetical protein